jgi:hypothetical protein
MSAGWIMAKVKQAASDRVVLLLADLFACAQKRPRLKLYLALKFFFFLHQSSVILTPAKSREIQSGTYTTTLFKVVINSLLYLWLVL